MELRDLTDRLTARPIPDQLRELASIFPGMVVFTTSFGLEDQVLTHIIFEENIPVRVATIDTGRLFPETYKVLNEVIKRYKKQIEVYFPEYEPVEKMMTGKGPFSFYLSPDNRLECCRIRKVEPLQRILGNSSCWITGIRADQSDNRRLMKQIDYDETRKLWKFLPLLSWSDGQTNDFIIKNSIPYNKLHDKGFASIGCQPCTRAVEAGEDLRSGRWWWENDGRKECGLHLK
ncbi:MAG: phosphoadenylyl-sulfate reductase [Bacteroidales bacterium]